MSTKTRLISLATALSLSVTTLLAATPAQASCQGGSGYVCLYRDHGGSGPQHNTKGDNSRYDWYTYLGTSEVLNDTVSRVENRSASYNYRVRLFYDINYGGQKVFGCVNPGQNWDLPGGGWGNHPGDGQYPDDNASSHKWEYGSSSSCVG